MQEFDRLVTVPGLTLARATEHLEHLDADRYLDGEYRAIKTSGATGTEAVHVYGFEAFVTFVMQGSRWTGQRGEAPDAVLAQIFSCSPKHESGIFHAFSTFESGGPSSHCFSGTMPLADLVAGLNAAEPKVEALQGWPSVIRQLALESLAGRLMLVPTWVSVAGEVCTPPVREAVRAAWGIELSEFWGCSEGTYAFPCVAGEGMHIADDLVILEPVDTQGNIVPYGQPADRVLLTNLYNLDQPLIRYDIADGMTITDAPCPCGCAHRRITDVQGRMDGVFEFKDGAAVPRRAFRTGPPRLTRCSGLLRRPDGSRCRCVTRDRWFMRQSTSAGRSARFAGRTRCYRSRGRSARSRGARPAVVRQGAAIRSHFLNDEVPRQRGDVASRC